MKIQILLSYKDKIKTTIYKKKQKKHYTVNRAEN